MGRDLAALVHGGRNRSTAFPLTPLHTLRWHGIAPALVRGLVQVYRVRDMVDEFRLGRAT
jgi:hypothetical protein